MSKRFFPQQHGERKKAKLNITISDHNFPLSQNAAANNADNWGDDNDDEILLMASQACEEVYGNNSTLPDFSLCMQPAATSTQMFPQPGPSKSPFQFKKPTTNSPQLTSVQLKDKCNRISSPLPGMSSKITTGAESMNYKNDLIYNDRVYKGQDSDHFYKQLLQLQEENAKLKSENGKLLDKCVTKEGEASILRTQLKTCQVAVDNARMEKVRAQGKVQMEWNEKLSTVTGQMQDLRTQLDFKNLEIISIKEKCRMLESTKVKLTQVIVPNSDISSSHRHSNSTYNPNLSQRRVKMTSIAAQTDGKAHFMKLNKEHTTGSSKLSSIMPVILEPTSDQPSLLDYNENLQAESDSLHNCRVFNKFHRIPATPAVTKHKTDSKITMNCIHEDFSYIVDGVNIEKRFEKIVKATITVLKEVQNGLQLVCSRAGAPFQREMDERYIEAAGTYECVSRLCLLSGRALFKEEQAILARRMVALLAYILDPSRRIPMEQIKAQIDNAREELLQIISDICNLLDCASCATLYSGLLYSISILLSLLPSPLSATVIKSIISGRPMLFTLGGILSVLRRLACDGVDICARGGNMRMDFEQGVLLFKKESCHLHVLLKQIEVALKYIEKQNLPEEALSITQNLLAFYSNYNARNNLDQESTRCDCQLVLLQITILALRTCSVMADDCKSICAGVSSQLQAACRSGILVLHRGAARDLEFGPQLGAAEGTFQELCERSRGRQPSELYGVSSQLQAACRSGILVLHRGAARDLEFGPQLGAAEGTFQELCERSRGRQPSELYDNMLFELAATFQCAVEETPSYHRQAWLKSFESFSLAD